MPATTNWSGSVWGNVSGTIFAEFVRDGHGVQGRVRLFEPGFGYLDAIIRGTWNHNNEIDLALEQLTPNYNVPIDLPQSVTLKGVYDDGESIIQGTWQTNIGTDGKFILVKTTGQLPVAASPSTGTATTPPPALVTKTVALRSVRLDEQSLRRLAELVSNGTNVGTPAINAVVEGREFIHVGVDSLMSDPSVPDVIYATIISASELAINQGTRNVNLNLKKKDANILFVSGYDRVWVEGKASQIEAFFVEHESRATHYWRTYGADLNTITFLMMIVFLPSVPLVKNRFEVVIFVFALLMLLAYSWKRLPNTKVFLRHPKTTWYSDVPSLLLVLLEVALSGFIAWLIARYVHP